MENTVTPTNLCDACNVPLGPDDCCPDCNVHHGDPCLDCGRRGMHVETCPALDEEGMMTPKPAKLDPTALYSGDNGRVFCGSLACAGMSAYFDGRDVSGKRVHAVTMNDRIAAMATYGGTYRCEGCQRGYANAMELRLNA